MNRNFLSVIFIFCLLVFSAPSALADTPGLEKAVADGAIVIYSRTLDVDHTMNIVTFTGDVKAVNEEMVILCRQMKVYYIEAEEGGVGETSYSIEKIVSTGDVHITRALGGVATAQKAVYLQAEEKMILTGNPVVKQEKDYVEGDRIIFYINENRSVAESDEGRRVKAVIFPGGDRQ